MESEAAMRRVSRFIFTFVMTIPMVAATSLLIEGFRDKPAPALMFLRFIKYFICGVGFVFWYWVSTRIFKLSRDEELRARETPSETELRRAHERRDPALDAAEREYYEKVLASVPESEREALLKKQKAWEDRQKKD